MGIKMRVKEYAYACGIRTIGELSRHADIPLSTARRLWFSTADGLAHGPLLRRIDLEVLEKCARFFDVEPGALLEMVKQNSGRSDPAAPTAASLTKKAHR